MHAAGAVCEGVDRVCAGSHRNVFCAVRPPGHHAGPTGVVTNEVSAWFICLFLLSSFFILGLVDFF